MSSRLNCGKAASHTRSRARARVSRSEDHTGGAAATLPQRSFALLAVAAEDQAGLLAGAPLGAADALAAELAEARAGEEGDRGVEAVVHALVVAVGGRVSDGDLDLHLQRSLRAPGWEEPE